MYECSNVSDLLLGVNYAKLIKLCSQYGAI